MWRGVYAVLPQAELQAASADLSKLREQLRSQQQEQAALEVGQSLHLQIVGLSDRA